MALTNRYQNEKLTNLELFQPPSTASDVFTLGSLMVFLLTNGKTWIKSFEDAAVITSTTDHWLHKRYSEDLMALLCQMLSTKPEERPTAEEICEETFKNKRLEKPELIMVDQLDEFLVLQEQLVSLLPKISFQRTVVHWHVTITFEQWTRWLSERVTDLRRQAGQGEEGVINVGDFIRKLSHLLKHLQDPMSEANLRQACFLLRKIEKLAQVKEYGEIEMTWL